MTRSAALVAILLIGNFALESSAQSLGELARREEERRRQTPPGKQYTNADLPDTDRATVPAVIPPEPGPAAPATAPADPAAANGRDAEADAASPRGREKRDEKYWRARASELRGHVQRTQTEIRSVEARLATLETRAATSDALQERDVTATHLRKLRQNLQSFGEEVERFEQRARADRVPADWIK